MSKVLRVLHQEHTNLGKLLKILERRFAEIAAADGSNLELICDILEYLQNYPDACHHPTEDAILNKLRKRDPKAAKRIGELERDHERLGRDTKALAASVGRLFLDESVPREEIHSSAKTFIENYWQHMNFEEEQFFPTAERALTPSDWCDIEAEIQDPADPLFSPHTAERYWRLRYEIFETDGAT